MAFSDIKKSILDEAHKQAEECRLQGSKEVAKIRADWENKVKTKKQELLKALQKRAEQKLLQAKFQIQNETQAQVLRKKQEILDQVYKSALDKLNQLGEEQYINLMVRLLKDLPQGEADLISVSGKEKWLAKALKQSNCNHKLSSETVAGQGGFVFQSSQVEIDCTFEVLLEEIKTETNLVVAEKIFNS